MCCGQVRGDMVRCGLLRQVGVGLMGQGRACSRSVRYGVFRQVRSN